MPTAAGCGAAKAEESAESKPLIESPLTVAQAHPKMSPLYSIGYDF